MRAGAQNDENLNETLERVFNNIEGSAVGADSEYDIRGLLDDLDVNSSKLGQTVAKRNEKLVKLLDAIGDLSLGEFADNTIDAFGDAYEYLMTMYASSAEEGLDADATSAFIEAAFRDGAVQPTGTAITKILPPVTRFGEGGGHAAKKQAVLVKLGDFFDRYFGLS